MKKSKENPKTKFEDLVREQIANGDFGVGDYLPSERELGDRYGVSSRKVREGLARLDAEGLIERHQGRGTLVRATSALNGSPVRQIAVVLQGRVQDSATAEYVDTLQQSFQREGIGTTLYVADGVPEREAHILRSLTKESVRGIVLFSAHESTSFAHVTAARAAGARVVLLDHYFPECPCSSVSADHWMAGYESTHHLVRAGCRSLLAIRSEADWSSHTLRQEGFESATAEAGLARYSCVRKIPRALTKAELRDYIRRILGDDLFTERRPLGVLAHNDRFAVDIIDVLQAAGDAVPSDVAVVGLADDSSAMEAAVPLTTMEIPRVDIARTVANVLLAELRDPTQEPQRILIKPRLIMRESCGCYALAAKGAKAGALCKETNTERYALKKGGIQ